MAEADRQAVLTQALKDPKSEYYQNFIKILRDCQLADERAKAASPYVGFPFVLDSAVQSALEAQFSIHIRASSSGKRMPLTDRVAGMMCLLDAAMLEHSGGAGRSVLFIDGDVATMAACGFDGRIVERTYATPRLMASYALEDDQVHRCAVNVSSKLHVRACAIQEEMRVGGGEHYHPRVRADGPFVDSLVVNHFRTPCGPTQLAYVALKRKAIVYGCIPFQTEMMTAKQGKLACFPGRFYIDEMADAISLVPEQDASLSVSMPYSAWKEVVFNNSVTVAGVEFLCEKYASVPGVLYYTLNAVDSGFEAPEVLRTHYCDKAKFALTELRFPKVKFSREGVPVGWDRGSVRVPTERCNKVMARLSCSSSDPVTPAEAFGALMDHNNTVINTLDTTRKAERMSVDDEMEAAMALALHVNWVRHSAKGTFNSLLSAVKLRYGVADTMLPKFAMVALASWWHRPTVRDSAIDGELPVQQIVDWCGNDFTVIMSEVDPWIEIAQEAGNFEERDAVTYCWLPQPPREKNSCWFRSVLERARRAAEKKKEIAERAVSLTKATNPCFPTRVKCPDTSIAGLTVVGESSREVVRDDGELTALKKDLAAKLYSEQGASKVEQAVRSVHRYDQMQGPTVPAVPVVSVDPVSAIRDDLLMVNGGPFESIGPAMGYRLAETELSKNVNGNLKLNDARREVPRERHVRMPRVNAGVEGVRIGSSMSLCGALFKRNVGIPSNRGVVNLDNIAGMAVDRMISTCYRSEWQDVVNKHLEAGMWQFNNADIENFLGNVDEKKARALLNEYFVEGHVELDRWLLMAKGAVKPSREEASDTKIDHSQTIMYLQNSTVNAAYSSMVRHFKECIDECLRLEVSINPQRSDKEHEVWYNSLNGVRDSHQQTYSYGSDIRCFDRSQEHVASRIHMEFYKRHGLDEARLHLWESMYGVKRAVNMMYGVVLVMCLGGVSGVFDTLLRNGVINWAAVIVSTEVKRSDIVMLDIKGDDMDAEFSRPIAVETTIENMSLEFNLSAKFFTNDVRYCCKTFRVKWAGWWYFIADPWAKVQALCKPVLIGRSDDDLGERYQSLKSDLRYYDNGILMDLVAECAQTYYGLQRPLYGMTRGLSAIIGDVKLYYNFFKPIERIS